MGSGFDYITQGQGPTVPISLFGDASSAGINAGNAQKTTIQSIVEGATKGVQTGLSVVSGIQGIQGQALNNQARQHAIDQFPVQDAIQQQHLEQMENQTDASNIDLSNKVATNDQNLAVDKLSLSAKQNTLQNVQDTAQQFKDFSDTFAAAAPREQANMVLGGQYTGLFGQRPQLYKSGINALQDNPTLTDTEKEFVQTQQKKSGALDFYSREAAKRLPVFNHAKEDYLADPITTQLHSSLQGAPEAFADQVLYLPKGKTSIDEKGNVRLDNTGGPIYKNDGSYVPTKTYDVFQKGPDGQPTRLLATDATQKSFDTLNKYQSELKYQNGTYGQAAAKQITTPPPVNQPQRKFSDVFAPKQQAVAVQGKALNSVPSQPVQGAELPPDAHIDLNTDAFHSAIITNLHLTQSNYDTLKPTIDKLRSQTENYSNAIGSNSAAQSQIELNSTVRQVARSITDHDFETNAAVRAQYTPEMVAGYNASLKSSQVIQKINPFATPYERQATQDILAAYQVTDPKDLYYARQSPIIVSRLNGVIRDTVNTQNFNKTLPLRQQAAGRQQIDLLTGPYGTGEQ